jgi:hypothetical protein
MLNLGAILGWVERQAPVALLPVKRPCVHCRGAGNKSTSDLMTKYKRKIHKECSGNLFRSVTNKCKLTLRDNEERNLEIASSGSEFFFACLSLFPRHKTLTLLFVPLGSKLCLLF